MARTILASPDLGPLVHAFLTVDELRAVRATCRGARDVVDTSAAWGVPIVEGRYRLTTPRALFTEVPYEDVVRLGTCRGLERSTVISLCAPSWGSLFGSDANMDRLKRVLSALLTCDNGCQIRLRVNSGEPLVVAPDTAAPGILQTTLNSRVRAIAQWYYSNIRREDLHRSAHLVIGDALFMGATKCKRESVVANYVTMNSVQQRNSDMERLSENFSITHRAVAVLMAWYHGRTPPTAQYAEEWRAGHVPAAGLVRSLQMLMDNVRISHVREGNVGFKTGWFSAGFMLLLERILTRCAPPSPDGTSPPLEWYGQATLGFYNCVLHDRALARILGPGMYGITDTELRATRAQLMLARVEAKRDARVSELRDARAEAKEALSRVCAAYARQSTRLRTHSAAWDVALGPQRVDHGAVRGQPRRGWVLSDDGLVHSVPWGDKADAAVQINMEACKYPMTYFKSAHARIRSAVAAEQLLGHDVAALKAVRTQLYTLDCMSSHFNVFEHVVTLRAVCAIVHGAATPHRGVFAAVRPFVETVRDGRRDVLTSLVLALQHTAGLQSSRCPSHVSFRPGPHPYSTAHVLLAMGTTTTSPRVSPHPHGTSSVSRYVFTSYVSAVNCVDGQRRLSRIRAIADAARSIHAFDARDLGPDYAFGIAFVMSAIRAAREVDAHVYAEAMCSMARNKWPSALVNPIAAEYALVYAAAEQSSDT